MIGSCHMICGLLHVLGNTTVLVQTVVMVAYFFNVFHNHISGKKTIQLHSRILFTNVVLLNLLYY